jgi:hypothetical protein
MASRYKTDEEVRAECVGFELAYMGHTDMMDAFKDRPELRKAFEEGWAAAVEALAEKEEAERDL